MELECIILLAAQKISLTGIILSFVLAIVLGIACFFVDVVKSGFRTLMGKPPPFHQVIKKSDLRGAEDVFHFFLTPNFTEQELSAALDRKHVTEHTRKILQPLCATTLEEFRKRAKAGKPLEGIGSALIEKGVPGELVPKLLTALLKAIPDVELNATESHVQIILDDELENFTAEKQERFLEALSGTLGCSLGDLKITYLGRGSLVVELHFESDEALALFVNEHYGSHPRLKSFLTDWKVRDVKLSPKLKKSIALQRDKAAVGGPTPASQPGLQFSSIFVSYSHKDRKHLDELKQFLSPYLRNEQLEFWSDDNIQPGDEWKKKIEQALEDATVAILLVSPSFAASDFIRERELPLILDRSRCHDFRIFWVPLYASAFETLGLSEVQAAYPTKKPLGALGKSKRCEAWTQIARMISDHIDKTSHEAQRSAVLTHGASGEPVEEPASMLETCSHCQARVLFLTDVCPNCKKAKAHSVVK